MGRVQRRFSILKKGKRKAFIAYITAGYPDIRTTEKLVIGFDKVGVDIVELGVPFSDPLADGPTIQSSSEKALQRNISLKKIINLTERIRNKTQIPIVLMTYYNPVLRYGLEKFVKDSKRAGVDGVIIPDLPPEEAEELVLLGMLNDFDVIFLLAPTSTKERIEEVAKLSTGFIYYVSLTGVTGARDRLGKDVAGSIRRIRAKTKKPIAVGFGISTPEQVKRVSKLADGVIMGSSIIKIISKNMGERDLVDRTISFVERCVDQLK